MQNKTMFFGLLFSFLLVLTGCNQTNQDLNAYLQTGTLLDEEAKDFMPKLESLPDYKQIDYRYTQKNLLFFQSNSVALVVRFDEATYQTEKEKLTEPNGKPFSINTFTFHLADNNGFPKYFGMIGTSDEKKQIAYLYFHDEDLDYVNESMEDFVENYFDYDF